MAKCPKTKRRIFPAIMILIFLLGVVLFFVGARMVTDILLAYEASRPEYFMTSYMSGFDEEHVARLAEQIELDYDSNLIDESVCRDYMVKQFPYGANLEYRRNGALCTGSRLGYYIINDSVKLGTVVIEQTSCATLPETDLLTKAVSGTISSILGCSYGEWEIVREEFELAAPEPNHLTVTVPTTWTVKCNGYTLDANYIEGEPQKMETYAEFYDRIDLPYLVTYAVHEYTGGAELDIYNEDGELTNLYNNTADNERMFVSKYFDNDNTEIQEFTKDFLARYIRYGSGAQGNRYDNLARLREVLVPDSDFDSRMVEALDGLYYAHSKGDTIQNVTFNSILELNDGWYVDITYVLDTTGNKGVVTTSHNAKITIVNMGGRLRVSQLTSY